jgi:hypothetical protein
MMPNVCDFVPFFDAFFPLLNMFANEAASEGFSATISATFMFPARVSIQPITQHSHKLNLVINLCAYALPQRTAGPCNRAWLYYSHRSLTVLHGEPLRNWFVLIALKLQPAHGKREDSNNHYIAVHSTRNQTTTRTNYTHVHYVIFPCTTTTDHLQRSRRSSSHESDDTRWSVNQSAIDTRV